MAGIYIGGTERARTEHGIAASGYSTHSVTTIYALAVNDYVELKVYQSSGAALDVVSTGGLSEFGMVRIA